MVRTTATMGNESFCHVGKAIPFYGPPVPLFSHLGKYKLTLLSELMYGLCLF